MTWNADAQKLAVKVIGTVESGLKYDAVNYNDPITVGAFQWYGPRAANILQRIGATSPDAWDGMETSLSDDLTNYPVYSRIEPDTETVEVPSNTEITGYTNSKYDTGIPEYESDTEDGADDNDVPTGDEVPDYDPGDAPATGPTAKTIKFWQSRYLTRKEGNSIKSILFDNQAIQNAQALEDFQDYVDVAVRHDLDPEDNTQSLIFFMVMYHQSPKQALAVLGAASPDSDVDRLYDYCMKNSVLKKYKTRYSTALSMIKGGDSSGIELDTNIGDPDTDPDSDANDPSGEGTLATLAYVTERGSQLFLYDREGNMMTANLTGPGYWSFGGSVSDGGTTVPVEPDPDPDPSGTMGEKLVQWMIDHIGTWKYSQASGRLKPFTSGYTDCSGCVWTAYKKVAGIDIGTYTTPQSKNGRLVTTSRSAIRNGDGLLPGDLIFYHAYYRAGWPFNHVEMYTGNAEKQTIGQVGSDDPGPNLHAMSRYLDWGKLNVMARRYV